MTDLIQELYNKQNTTIDILKEKQLLKTPLCKLKIMGSYASYSSSGNNYSTSNIDQLKRNLILSDDNRLYINNELTIDYKN